MGSNSNRKDVAFDAADSSFKVVFRFHLQGVANARNLVAFWERKVFSSFEQNIVSCCKTFGIWFGDPFALFDVDIFFDPPPCVWMRSVVIVDNESTWHWLFLVTCVLIKLVV